MNPQGIYTLVSGGKTLERKMDAIANNLANVDTVGYKQDQPSFELLFSNTMGVARESDEERFANHEHLAPYTGVGTFHVGVAGMGTHMGQGRLMRTGNELDFALSTKDAWFSVNTPQGERFTRAGEFSLNSDGQLVTPEGYVVNGQEGPLTLQGNEIHLNEDGSILVDGEPAGNLRIVNFPFPERLDKMGGSLFAPGDAENQPRIQENVSLAQGMLESSNVEAVEEMTRMIQANRTYTTMQKALNIADGMNEQAITLAKV